MTVRGKFTSRLVSSWLPSTERDLDKVALRMVTDVDRFAKVLAPKDKGDLVNSGRIERIAAGFYKAAFGGSGNITVRYAKRRHFENKKNPHTLGYLKRAGNAVARNKAKYINGQKPSYK
jgi:hypothetical protein